MCPAECVTMGIATTLNSTQVTITLTQVVFWDKLDHSGPGSLLVSMVTGSRELKGGQVYIAPCNKGVGYGEMGKHRCLAGEQH